MLTQDPYYNCYVQVVGRKRIWLAPPDTPMPQYSSTTAGPEAAKTYMSNTSTIPIFKSTTKEVPGSMEDVLEPGDMLVMPPGWWHAMRGEGDGMVCSVSIWF